MCSGAEEEKGMFMITCKFTSVLKDWKNLN